MIYAPGNFALANAATLSAPTAPTATVNGSGAITIGWTLPGSQLAGAQYKVTRTSGPGSQTTVCTVASSVTSCQDTGLTATTSYGYSVVAVLGTSWQSSSISVSTITATPTLAISLSAAPYTAGTPITVQTITAKIGGGTDTTYSGSKSIAWSGLANSPSGQAPVYPSSSLTFVSGVASPTGAGAAFTAYAAGSNTLVGTDAAATSVTGSAPFTVINGTATQIVLGGSTTSLASGTTRVLTATIKDAAGNTVTGGTDSTDSVTFSQPTGAGSVTGLGAAPASGGIATKTVTGSLIGGVNLQASATLPGGLTSSNTLSFTVTFGTATQVALSGPAAGVGVGATKSLTATIEDSAGNTVTGGTDSTRVVTFAKTSGAGTVSGLGPATASGGVATVSVTGTAAGSVSVQASATLTQGVTSSNTLTMAVNPAPTISLPTAGSPVTSVHNGTVSYTITGTGFVSGLTVTGNGSATAVTVTSVTSTTITGTVTGSGGNGASGSFTVTNPDGGTVTSANGSFKNG